MVSPSLILNSDFQGKKVMPTFDEYTSSPSVKGSVSDIVNRGLFGADPVYQQNMDPRLAQNRREIKDQNDKYQNLFERLMVALEERAAVKRVVPQMQGMTPDQAQGAFAILAAARAMGARDPYVQGAAQNYIQGVDGVNQQQFRNDALQAEADNLYNTQQANLPIQQIESQMGQVQSQLKNLYGEQDNIYGLLEEELTQAGLDRRAMLTYKRMVDVEKMRSDSRMAIEQFKDDGAERMRFRDAAEQILTRQAETNLGRQLNPEEQKDIVERAGFMALSDKYLEYARMLGVEANTAYTQAKTETEDQTRPWKVKLEEAKVATEKERPGLMQSQANANNARASLYEATEQFLGPKFDLEVWKKLYDAEESGTPVGEDLREDALAQISEIDKGINSLESEIQMLRRQRIGADDDEKAEIDALISEYRQDIKDAKQLREGHQFTLDFMNKQPKPASEKPTPPKAPAPKSGASSDLHSSKRQDLISKFGVRVDHWSEPRKMRGGGGTGMSRHGSGRAIDVFYGDKKDEVLKYLQANGAKLIIDYVNQRTWVRGRGWKTNKNLDKSHKHFHVEYD